MTTDRYTLTSEQAIEAAAKIAENYRPQGDPIGLHPQIIAGKIRELARSEGTATPPKEAPVDDPNMHTYGENDPIPLLPCPFCGSTDLEHDNLGEGDDWFISCRKCEIQQIANYDKYEAVRRWNTRVSGESSTIGLTTCPVCDRSVDASGIEDTKAVKIGDSWYHGPCSRYAKRGESSTTPAAPTKFKPYMQDHEYYDSPSDPVSSINEVTPKK